MHDLMTAARHIPDKIAVKSPRANRRARVKGERGGGLRGGGGVCMAKQSVSQLPWQSRREFTPVSIRVANPIS